MNMKDNFMAMVGMKTQAPIEKPAMRDINNIVTLKSTATISLPTVQRLNEEISYFPDVNIIESLVEKHDEGGYDITCIKCNADNDDDAKFCDQCGTNLDETNQVNISSLTWNGEGSGKHWSTFIKKIVPHIRGTIEAIAQLEPDEDGSPPKLMGIVITDGVYQRCKVNVTLTPVNYEDDVDS